MNVGEKPSFKSRKKLDFSKKNRICAVFGLILEEEDLLQDGHPLFSSLIQSKDDIDNYTYPIASFEKLCELGFVKIGNLHLSKRDHAFLGHQIQNFKYPIPGFYVLNKPRISLPKPAQKKLKVHLQSYEDIEQTEFPSFL